MPYLAGLSDRDRRAIAIRASRCEATMGEVLKRCADANVAANEARLETACVLLMAKNDAPEDLQLTDPALYRRLRDWITDIRLGGWLN